jgi:hypothetical protein
MLALLGLAAVVATPPVVVDGGSRSVPGRAWSPAGAAVRPAHWFP